MNIFIIGPSHSGKSTLANYISNKLNYNHIEASGNLKQYYPIKNGESNIDYINRLSNTSKNLLLIEV